MRVPRNLSEPKQQEIEMKTFLTLLRDQNSKKAGTIKTTDIGGLETEDSVRYAEEMEQLKKVLFFNPDNLSRFSRPSQLCVVHIKEELYNLQRKKRDIVRKESELLYTLQDTLLQEDCYQLTAEMDRLGKIPEEVKSREEEAREIEILNSVINIVNRRHSMLENFHVERLSENKECEKVDDDYRKHKVALMKMMNGKDIPCKNLNNDYTRKEKKFVEVKQWFRKRCNASSCRIL